MHTAFAALASLLTLTPLALRAQTEAPAAPPPAQAPVTAFSMLQPAIADVQSTLSNLKIDKWKRGSVRDEAGDNVKAILHDLQENLPPLVTAADANQTALSQSIPLVKHLDAVYDVLLRVEEASRVSGPGDQVAQLQQTLKAFEKARLALDDRLQQNATDQEKRLTELQAALAKAQEQAKEVKPAPAPEPCKPPAPVKKKKRAVPSKPKPPATTPPAASTPAPPKTQ